MTSMKIVQISRPPTPLLHRRPTFIEPLDLERLISDELRYPPPSTFLQMITNQLKENIIQE